MAKDRKREEKKYNYFSNTEKLLPSEELEWNLKMWRPLPSGG